MNETKKTFTAIPKHLILEDRVYQLTVTQENGDRAFNRCLIDFRVEGTNPLSSSNDQWRTLLGMSERIDKDYPRLDKEIPIEWILFRFLCHHARSNSLHVLKGPNGQVLSSASFQDYLGSDISDEQADDVLRTILSSWVRVFPKNSVELGDLFVSTDITFGMLNRSINSLKFQDQIEEVSENTYNVKPSLFSQSSARIAKVSLDRRINRYYQEIPIQADEPFCFVIMPFREEEFKQTIYFDVIKPFIEEEFKISCFRVDEDRLPDRIDNKIYSYILRAAFVVAEVTTKNPNVLYELGLAHMLEKDCIILTQTTHSEIPFDINRISAEPYKNEEDLKSYLRKIISGLDFKKIQ